MKIIATDSPCLASNGLKSSVMGIDPKHAARITKYLRDSIYSDKILATIREIEMNGIDEHIKYNLDQPVLTGIKQEDSGYIFYVRDFAKGLSEKDVREVFGMYGASDKRNSNEQAGSFGCGSLAPFSYSDTFFVISHFEGTKTTYSCVLGGDEDNISVGHIYKIDERPTTESGLEVSVPVKNEDLAKFTNKIRDFVSLSPYNIEADILEKKIAPIIPVAEKKISDYNFRLLEYSGQYAGNVLFQMGGNTYKSQAFSGANGAKVKKDHVLVIDIPIGHCSITLSREGFEETTKNDKVFSEIQDILNNLAETDLNQFKTKTVLDLVKDSLAAMTAYQGDFFQTNACNLYKNVWKFVENTRIHNDSLPAEQKNGKPLCVVVPNNDARNYWNQKVKNYLKDSNRNLYIVSGEHCNLQNNNQAILDSFEFVCARKLPYPKIPKINGRFAVYRRTRRRGRVEMIGKFNALELFNFAAKEYDWKFQATTEKEASDFLAEKVKKVESNSELEQIAVRHKEAGSIFAVNSVAFLDSLESFGFVKVGGQTWQSINKKLNDKREKEQKKNEILSSAKKEFLVHRPQTAAAIKKVRHAERMGKFWTAILSEKSLRGKILKSLSDRYYSSSATIERHELKKILALR